MIRHLMYSFFLFKYLIFFTSFEWLREREETQQVCASCQVTVEHRDAGMVICYVSHRELYTPLVLSTGTQRTL